MHERVNKDSVYLLGRMLLGLMIQGLTKTLDCIGRRMVFMQQNFIFIVHMLAGFT